MLRLASARTPGSNRFSPVLMAASMSMLPTTRSSLALMGSSTTRIWRGWRGSSSPAALRVLQSRHCCSPGSGGQPNWHPTTTSCSGTSRASARTAVDLAVPFSPRIRTPPIAGLMALRTSAWRMGSWPTMAVNGKTERPTCMARLSLFGANSRHAAGSATAQAGLHAGQDRTLAQVVQPEVLTIRALGQVQARVEAVAATEQLRASRPRGAADRGQRLGGDVVAGGVDHQHAHALGADLRRQPLRLEQRLLTEQRDVAAAVA